MVVVMTTWLTWGPQALMFINNNERLGGMTGWAWPSNYLAVSSVQHVIKELCITHNDRHAIEKIPPLARPPARKVFWDDVMSRKYSFGQSPPHPRYTILEATSSPIAYAIWVQKRGDCVLSMNVSRMTHAKLLLFEGKKENFDYEINDQTVSIWKPPPGSPLRWLRNMWTNPYYFFLISLPTWFDFDPLEQLMIS